MKTSTIALAGVINLANTKLELIDPSQKRFEFAKNSVGTFGPCITDKDCVFVNSCCGVATRGLTDGFHIMCAPRNPIIQPNWDPTWVGFDFKCLNTGPNRDGSTMLVGSIVATTAVLVSGLL